MRQVQQRHAQDGITLNTLFQIILPIFAALLIIPWLLLPGTHLLFFNLLMGCFIGLCFSVFLLSVWMYLAAAAFEGHLAPNIIFAPGFLILSGAVFLSAIYYIILGDTFSAPVAPVLTIIYLVCICIDLTFKYTRTQPAAFRTDIDKACAVLRDIHNLSSREYEVLTLIGKGRSAIYIADRLSISPHTARAHIKHIHEKLNISSRQEIIDLIEREI